MKFVTASIISCFALSAFAQAPPELPTATQVNQATAVPVATPRPSGPTIGMNLDTTPTQAPPAQTPAPVPAEDLQRRMMEQAQRQNQNNGLRKAPEAEQKSEIIPVLPPAERPPELRAVLRTSVGDITIRLDRANAPHTVDYFSGIAKGDISFTDIKTSKPVKRPFYNGLIFHRVVKNTLIQTGDPFANGRGNSGQVIQDEIKPSMKFDKPGLVAMAPMRDSTGTKISKNTNSSQFFITLREMPEWNGEFTIFGEVEDGLDVVQKIANAKVGPTERPIKRIYLVAVDILDTAK